jgi:hypothetical protein
MTLSVRMILPALAVALVAWAPSASFAQLADWDQERVTAIAKEFAEAAQGVQDAFRKEPSQNIGSGQSRSYYRLQQLVRRIKTEARHLASQLENGKGHEETLPIYQNLMEEVRDAREDARRTFTSSFVLDKVAVANDALRRLAPYYDPKALSGD